MANIHDVARVAGVSISTVSYALSGKRSIGEDTRRRVEDAVRELDYLPNAAARMLAGTRTNILAVTAPLRADTYAPAHMAFVLAVATAARRYDYDVLLLTQDEATGGLRRVAASRLVDGIIVLDVSNDDERADLVRDLSIPAALVGVPGNAEGLICVDLDFEAAAALAVDRLADAGHRTLGLIGHPADVYERGANFPTRFRDGFLARARERGVRAAFAMPGRDAAGSRAALEMLTSQAPGLTGLVIHAEETIHTNVLELLRMGGISIPGDMSVISAGSTFDTSRFTPPLDVIPLVPAASCDRAVELAITQLSERLKPRVELIAPIYREHGSVGPPG